MTTPAPIQPSRKRAFSLNNPKVVPYVLVSPFVLYFLLVYLYPAITTVIMSFQHLDGPNSATFIGLTNYERMWSRTFVQAVTTTLRYTVWDLLILVPVPLLFAVLINSTIVKAASFFKALYFIPALTSIIVAGIVFRLAFGTLDTSLINQLTGLIGAEPRKWLMEAGTGNFVLILLTLWRWLGVNIVYYYSGLQAIPNELYEAAQIDGANAWGQFVHITLPGIKPVIIYVTTLTVLGGFSMFTESVALWQSANPGGIGRTIVGYMYMTGFNKNNMGMASTVGLVLLGMVLCVNLIQLWLMGFFKKENG